jgi:hypothetical protein
MERLSIQNNSNPINNTNNSDEIICLKCNKTQKKFRGEDILEKCQFCLEKFMYLKCYHCKKKVYFFNENMVDGVNIKCPYIECGKFFTRSSCGVCNKNLYFPDRYQEGSKVKCPFKECGEEFFKIICPNEKCGSKLAFKKNNPINGSDNLNNSTTTKNICSNYKEGVLVNCKSCNSKFQKINCYH